MHAQVQTLLFLSCSRQQLGERSTASQQSAPRKYLPTLRVISLALFSPGTAQLPRLCAVVAPHAELTPLPVDVDDGGTFLDFWRDALITRQIHHPRPEVGDPKSTSPKRVISITRMESYLLVSLLPRSSYRPDIRIGTRCKATRSPSKDLSEVPPLSHQNA